MAITHTHQFTWRRSGEQITQSVAITGTGEQNFEETVPGSGNVTISAEIDVSALTAVFILSTGDITLASNDDGTPDDSFTLKANKPLVWYSDCGLPNPFASTVDVSSFKATKASAGDATLKMRFLYDATP